MVTPQFVPPTLQRIAHKAGDPRIGHLLGTELGSDDKPLVVLIGFPCDEGVRRNGGRPGSSGACDVVRQAFFAMTPDARNLEPFSAVIARTRDLGNLKVSNSLEEAQQALGAAVRAVLEQGAVPIILGGGHETSFGHFLGHAAADGPLSVVNIDAHPDVRELVNGHGHSGSPFRQMIEHSKEVPVTYTVCGLLPHATAGTHLAFIEKKGGRAIFAAELTDATADTLYQGSGRILASFDIDAVDQAFAPGASAPAVGGMSAHRWLTFARAAGRSPAVRSMDVVETNPSFDRDNQTAKLAALTIWHFLAGLAERD